MTEAQKADAAVKWLSMPREWREACLTASRKVPRRLVKAVAEASLYAMPEDLCAYIVVYFERKGEV